jgi:hypothetical protein
MCLLVEEIIRLMPGYHQKDPSPGNPALVWRRPAKSRCETEITASPFLLPSADLPWHQFLNAQGSFWLPTLLAMHSPQVCLELIDFIG